MLAEVFSEAAIAASVKDESKGVVRGGINSEESDDVGVVELREHPYLIAVSLQQNPVNHNAVRKRTFLSHLEYGLDFTIGLVTSVGLLDDALAVASTLPDIRKTPGRDRGVANCRHFARFE